jgi:hypothetical protein
MSLNNKASTQYSKTRVNKPKEQDQRTKMAQNVQQKRTRSRSNSQPPGVNFKHMISGEKYPVKQDNRTQDHIYQPDGVVDMAARLGEKNHREGAEKERE